MSDIQTKVSEILRDTSRLKRLLMLEKQRRDMPQDALVFVGMANVASHWWCTQQAVFQSRAIELDVFTAYLFDRIMYSHHLGLLSTLPTNDEALLDVGSDFTWDDIEKMLMLRASEGSNRAKDLPGRASWLFDNKLDNEGKRTLLLNPDLPPEERRFWEEMAALSGIRVVSLEEDPKRRGEIYQESRAEKYPTIRWHFPWSCYSVGGTPDGLTKDFAYEYKTVRNRFLLAFRKPVALAQADLYAHFFRRPKKRVQLYIVEENATETHEETVSAAQAEDTLKAFARVDGGQPAHPPKAWKCRKCDFRATCPISQAQ
jgi:hypothetical protein